MFAIGSSLREARLRQGLSFAEVEQATKIRHKHLQALEDEQFDVLPAQTYVKGFLRTYAEYLGLDGQLYVDEFNSRYATGDEDPQPIARTSVGRSGRRVDSRKVALALLGIAAVTGLVIAASRSGEPSESPNSVPRLGEDTTPTVTRPSERRREPRRRPVRARLVLTASQGPSWIEVHVRNSAGRQLFEGTLEQGQSLPVRARRLWLVVGQPANLTWRLNGRNRPAPSVETGTFVVTAKGIRSTTSV